MLWYTLCYDNKTVYIIKLPLGPIKSVAIPLLDFTRNGHKYLTSTVQPATCNFPCWSFQWSFHCQALPRWPPGPSTPCSRSSLPSSSLTVSSFWLRMRSAYPLRPFLSLLSHHCSFWGILLAPLHPPDHSVLQHLLQLHSFSLWGYPSQAISSHLHSLVQTSAWDSRAVSGGLFILPLACIMRLLNSTYPKGNSWFPPLNLFFLKCSQP